MGFFFLREHGSCSTECLANKTLMSCISVCAVKAIMWTACWVGSKLGSSDHPKEPLFLAIGLMLLKLNAYLFATGVSCISDLVCSETLSLSVKWGQYYVSYLLWCVNWSLFVLTRWSSLLHGTYEFWLLVCITRIWISLGAHSWT